MQQPRRPLVFVLEDNLELTSVIQRALNEHSLASETFSRVRSLEARLRRSPPDLCLLDIQLPDGDGITLLRDRLLSENIPVILITGVYRELPDRVLGLELGADDYILKPFEPRELVARIKVVLRRLTRGIERRSQTARFAGWTADFESFQLTAPDGEIIKVSASECRLLFALVSSAQRICTREMLLRQAERSELPFDRSIDVRISRLRQKLRDDPKNPRLLKTVYGAGYLFTAAVVWNEPE